MSKSGSAGKTTHPSELLEFATIVSPGQIEHVEHIQLCTLSRQHSDAPRSLNALIQGSRAGVVAEHDLTTLKALWLFPKAIGWSILLSLTIVMEAYDTTLLGSFFAFPQFQKAYGLQSSNEDYQVSTAWQSGLSNGSVAGEILGLLISGYLSERFGYRWSLIGLLLALSLFIFFAVFAANIRLLMASEVLCGLSWGGFQIMSTTYAAEIMPVSLRAHLTSTINMCWVIGQFIGTGVIRSLIGEQSEWSYRIPFAIQWVWALPILIGVFFAPESPWWLVRHNQYEKAKATLRRLMRSGPNCKADEIVQLMKETNEIERQLSAGLSYLDCFRGVNLRRTEIACIVWVTQVLSGTCLFGYAAYFYVQAGISVERAFDICLCMYGIAIVGTVIFWLLTPVVGRRTLYLWGTGLMSVILVTGGIVGLQPEAPWIPWTLSSLIMLLIFVYNITIGPVCYALVAEIPSTRLRVKTVVLARIAYNIAGIFQNVLLPQMLNPTAWNLKEKMCFLWAGTCLLCLLWCWFRLPEPKGLTFLEIDLLFEKRVNARKFRRITETLSSAGYFDIKAQNRRDISEWRPF